MALLSAVYASRSAKQAKAANDIGRLNALLSLRVHYLELMARESEIASQIKGMKGADNAWKSFAALDSKLREVNKEIGEYHSTVVQ